MTSTETWQRRIELEGLANFRDLGGYETRDGRSVAWRRLFRSDALHALTPADLQTLSAHGIDVSTAFDLRTFAEVERHGWGIWQEGRSFRHVPFVPEFAPDELQTSIGLCERLLDLFERSTQCFADMFSALAEPQTYPAVFFCSAGKDRTGMMSAAVLSILGVPDDVIVADFALTKALDIEAMRAKAAALGISGEIDPNILEARAETMALFLSEITSRYGSFEEHLGAVGVSDEQIDAVRTNLLEG